jgi:hypothetical protein
MISDITPPNPQGSTPPASQPPKTQASRLRRKVKRTSPLARKQGLQLHKFPQPQELLRPKEPVQPQAISGFGSGSPSGVGTSPSGVVVGSGNATDAAAKAKRSSLHIAARAARTAVASQTEPSPYLPMVISHTGGTMQVQPAKHSGWRRLWHKPSRLQWLIGGAAVILLVAGGGATWALTHHKTPVVAVKTVKHAAKPKPVAPPSIAA